MSTAVLPVFRGGALVASATVDLDDYGRLSKFRWYMNRDGGVVRSVPPRGTNSIGREVVGLQAGEGRVVHHINEDPLDNRRSNLKVCADHAEHGAQPHPKKSKTLKTWSDGRTFNGRRWSEVQA